MTSVEKKMPKAQINERLANGGFRFTPQRQRVYDVLLGKRDHPTADEVFFRARHQSPEISMATVYNCLDALVKCGLVKQVNMDRGASRFCPNMHEHCHFYCDSCGGVFDVDFDQSQSEIPMPRGFKATHFDLSVRGLCSGCAAKKR
jgi:Fur family transcriptional regulator, peroxide stress response regulator